MLIVEIYKTLNYINQSFTLDYFLRKDTKCDLRIKDALNIPTTTSVFNGMDSIKFRGSLLWNSMLDLIKSAHTAAIFRKDMENWSGEKFSCKICR